MLIFEAKSIVMKKILLFISLALPLLASAQDESSDERHGVRFGLNMGLYIPSRISANYYNGSGTYNDLNDPNGVRMYTIEDRLRLTPQTIQTITSYYNASGFHFNRDSYPAAMRYNSGYNIGLQIAFDLNNTSSFIFNVNACKVKTVDRFTMVLEGTTAIQNGQEDVRLFFIQGNEQRLNSQLGYRTGWELERNGLYFIEFGGSMLMTKVMGNQVTVANQQYDLIIGANNPNQIVNYMPRAGTGFGYYFSSGFFIPFGKQSAEISFSVSHDKMKLNNTEFKGWNKMLMVGFSM